MLNIRYLTLQTKHPILAYNGLYGVFFAFGVLNFSFFFYKKRKIALQTAYSGFVMRFVSWS
jgi:hypothetical protein